MVPRLKRLEADKRFGDIDQERLFYANAEMDQRMKDLRERGIRNLRRDDEAWSVKYARHAAWLRDETKFGLLACTSATFGAFFRAGPKQSISDRLEAVADIFRARAMAHKLFNRKQAWSTWDDRPPNETLFLRQSKSLLKLQANMPAVRLYTSSYGHVQLYQAYERAYLRPNQAALSTQDERHAEVAAFIIELVTIELYHLWHIRKRRDFEGIVWRGLAILEADAATFAGLAPTLQEPEHKLAIPLALLSATTSEETAVQWACRRRSSDRTHALVWQIHVYSLDDKILEGYHRLYENSVVTSICAVELQDISIYDSEDEVLLRGPFFQCIGYSPIGSRMFESELVNVPILHLVMLNTNRDHKSALATHEGSDKLMRDLFNSIVSFDRALCCAQAVGKHGWLERVPWFLTLARTYLATYSRLAERPERTWSPDDYQSLQQTLVARLEMTEDFYGKRERL